MATQVEKFNARMAKMKRDEEVIETENFKNSTVKKVGEKIAEKHGVSTEDIFMIVTRDSMESFMNLWNNSLGNTLENSIKDVVREVIRDELLSAYKGILKGFETEAPKTTEQSIQDLMPELFAVAATTAEVERKPIMKDPNEQQFFDYICKCKYYDRLENAIKDAAGRGYDPTIGKDFKKVEPTYNTLYQKFMKDSKKFNAPRGTWKKFVGNILKSL